MPRFAGPAVRHALALACILPALLPLSASAQKVLKAEKSSVDSSFSWLKTARETLHPNTFPSGKIPPMITWEGFGYDPLTDLDVKMLLERGITPHLHMDAAHIPAALALQKAGAPVVLMQGGGGNFPAELAGKPEAWAHQFDAGYKPKEGVRPCPSLLGGWAAGADQVRDTLRKFKAAGVTVNAVWLDWEGDPLYGKDRYDQAIHCSRCRALLPPALLASQPLFEAWCRRRFVELIGTYLAAPVLEVFPACSVTNWNAMVSTPEHPLNDWDFDKIDSSMPAFFTATNTAAYGDTKYWHRWNKSWKLTQEHVDQFWFHSMIEQLSVESANRLKWMPEKSAIPWVARWLPENDEVSFPVMTRERYRELLRHLWLRGIKGMQVFNPRFKGYEKMAVYELEDAASIYSEMMRYHDLIENGTPFGLEVPAAQSNKVVWSGLRTSTHAVIRAFKQGGGTASAAITVWPGSVVTFPVDSRGVSAVVEKNENGITVTVNRSEAAN